MHWLDTEFYIIRPKDELIKLRDQKYPSQGSYLCVPSVWLKEEIGRRQITQEEDDAVVKMVYLARIKNLINDIPSPELHLFVNEVLGLPPYHFTIFDRWWTLEKMFARARWIQEIYKVPSDILRQFLPIGKPLADTWMEDIIEMKKNDIKPDESPWFPSV